MRNLDTLKFASYMASSYSGTFGEDYKSEFEAITKKFMERFNEKIISAAQYYMGKPDGKFFKSKHFDDSVVNAKKAYVTLNTLMGGDSSELDRFCEGKKQFPGLITPEGIHAMLDLFTCLAALSIEIGDNATEYETVRACRQSEIKVGKCTVKALTSTTKLSVDEIMTMGYGDKNNLAICRYKFRRGARIIDMEELGEAYLKKEEREVLLLMGTELNVKFCGIDKHYLGKDGTPAFVYEIEVLPHQSYESRHEELLRGMGAEISRATVFNEKIITEVRHFYEQLNTSDEFPEIPENYLKWKEAFQFLVMDAIKLFV